MSKSIITNFGDGWKLRMYEKRLMHKIILTDQESREFLDYLQKKEPNRIHKVIDAIINFPELEILNQNKDEDI